MKRKTFVNVLCFLWSCLLCIGYTFLARRINVTNNESLVLLFSGVFGVGAAMFIVIKNETGL